MARVYTAKKKEQIGADGDIAGDRLGRGSLGSHGRQPKARSLLAGGSTGAFDPSMSLNVKVTVLLLGKPI
jgi:hypothetical protein